MGSQENDFISRYKNTVAVEAVVYRNLKEFLQDKKEKEHLFNWLSTSDLNQYLNYHMEGLTAKVIEAFQGLRYLNLKWEYFLYEPGLQTLIHYCYFYTCGI